MYTMYDNSNAPEKQARDAGQAGDEVANVLDPGTNRLYSPQSRIMSDQRPDNAQQFQRRT
jgi:hypothetical protein